MANKKNSIAFFADEITSAESSNVLTSMSENSLVLAPFNSKHTGQKIDNGIDLAHSHPNKSSIDRIGGDDIPTWNGLTWPSGEQGPPGKDALINGMNVLNIVDGLNTSVEIDGTDLKINVRGSGVSGTMERRSVSATTFSRVALMANRGRTQDINSDGEWVCPKSGYYSIYTYFGAVGTSGDSINLLQLNNVGTTTLDSGKAIGISKSSASTYTPSLSVQLWFDAGDRVSSWIYASIAQAAPSSQSYFTIMQMA